MIEILKYSHFKLQILILSINSGFSSIYSGFHIR